MKIESIKSWPEKERPRERLFEPDRNSSDLKPPGLNDKAPNDQSRHYKKERNHTLIILREKNRELKGFERSLDKSFRFATLWGQSGKTNDSTFQ